jgi:ADP-heptose:LPS heptosyltransferase
MRVQTMRNIDAWIGIPLCFAATIVQRILHLFHRVPQRSPHKVLFIELSEMGSAILAEPAMHKLKQASGAELYFLIFERCKESLQLVKTIPAPHVCTIRDTNLLTLALDVVHYVVWTRRQGIDTVIDLELFSRFTALLTFLSGAPNRVGFYAYYHEGLYRGELLTHKVSYNPHIHIAKNFIALVAALLSPHREVPYTKVRISDEEIRLQKITYPASETHRMHVRVKHYYPPYTPHYHSLVVVNPNASAFLPQRRWMPHYYVTLIQQILAHHPQVLILITGAPDEQQEAETMTRQVAHERCINVAGAFQLPELPVLYSISTCMITNDSGPAHFASLTEMPTFVFFGPETPTLYGPLGDMTPLYAGLACSPCVTAANHRRTPCHDNVCLQIITPAYVYNLIKPVLQKSTPATTS